VERKKQGRASDQTKEEWQKKKQEEVLLFIDLIVTLFCSDSGSPKGC
jgi:hypothetical protein